MDYEPRDLDQGWDWQAFVRYAGWAVIAAVAAREHRLSLLAVSLHALGTLLFLWMISFGVLDVALFCALEAGVRLVLALEAAVYAVSGRLVRRAAGDVSPSAHFLAAFATEAALVLATARVWVAMDLSSRLAVLLTRALR